MALKDRLAIAAKSAFARTGYTIVARERARDLNARARMGDRYPAAMVQLEELWRTVAFDRLGESEQRTSLLSQLQGTEPSEGLHLIGWLHEALAEPGAICEIGCAHGATSALIANELGTADRQFWVFDSFQGLSEPTAEDELIDDIFSLGSMAAYEGTMAYPESEVRSRVAATGWPAERLHVVAGYVDDSLGRPDLPDTVAFAYVDLDLYAPIARSLAWLEHRVVPGGIVMVDDYGWFSSGAKRAVDEYLAAHPDWYEVLHPPTWAGHFIAMRRLPPVE